MLYGPPTCGLCAFGPVCGRPSGPPAMPRRVTRRAPLRNLESMVCWAGQGRVSFRPMQGALRLRSAVPRAAQLLAPRAALLRTSAVRMADEGERKNVGSLVLNFTMPDKALYEGVPVEMALLPGGDGMFGVMPNHVPTIAELKPGVVSVQEEPNGALVKYFISGGFASSAQRCRPNPLRCRALLRRLGFARACRPNRWPMPSATTSRRAPFVALAFPQLPPLPWLLSHLCAPAVRPPQ